MSFQITGLLAEDFAYLFLLSDEELAARGAVRRSAGAHGGYACPIVQSILHVTMRRRDATPLALTVPEGRSGPLFPLPVSTGFVYPESCLRLLRLFSWFRHPNLR
jgi:hypothetical protein